MKSRCLNPNNASYKNYGGRGISVCKRWMSFKNFYADMGDRPEGYTLERVDNDKGYSPDNCVWASRFAQSRNRRSLIMITMDGETHPLSVWVERYGGNYATIHMRIAKGWDAEKAIKTPEVTERAGVPRGRAIHDYAPDLIETPFGKMTFAEAVKTSGLAAETIKHRLKRGWPLDAALLLPSKRGQRKALIAFGAERGVKFHDSQENAA